MARHLRLHEMRNEISSENSSPDSCTIGSSVIRVDALVELLAVEEILEKLLDLGDTVRICRESEQINE